ncbi:hypothetical protein TSUD_247940 [Trifolium subterraneum]|uniref:LOB domain-containing protein n=1 Tax=Trifolium subterraneum TaxID=3900 RepID=A0A2Z6P6L2_TRISU|nr:hypothetical protein TSUD_247940 [Trifolium subterraneum]
MADQGHIKCAECKHAKKKCANCCIRAFLLEGEGEDDYEAILNVFTLDNFKSWMEHTSDEQKAELVESMAWEAGVRMQFPVTGAYGIYNALADENVILKQRINTLKQQNKILEQSLKLLSQGKKA